MGILILGTVSHLIAVIRITTRCLVSVKLCIADSYCRSLSFHCQMLLIGLQLHLGIYPTKHPWHIDIPTTPIDSILKIWLSRSQTSHGSSLKRYHLQPRYTLLHPPLFWLWPASLTTCNEPQSVSSIFSACRHLGHSPECSYLFNSNLIDTHPDHEDSSLSSNQRFYRHLLEV